MDDHGITGAALLGIAGGIRTTAPLAALAARGRLGTGAGRIAVFAATAGELATDKIPVIPPRTQALPLFGRIASGGVTGTLAAGRVGGLVAAAAAAGSTYAATAARAAITGATGVPDPVVAVAEDALALGIGVLGARLAA